MADPSVVHDISFNTDHTSGWDWENKHVSQSYGDNTGLSALKDTNIHDIVESGTVLIAAGPADLEVASSNSDNGVRIVPIGLVESASIGMNKPLSRIFEIGSKLSYIIPGRTVGQIQLSRVFFDGPSLLKVLYAGEVTEDKWDGENKKAIFSSNENQAASLDDANGMQPIGSGQVAMNLASTFFDQPVGLGFYFRDQENDDVGTIFFEGCRVGTYNMGISANMNVLTEAISMEFTQCVPVVSSTASVAPAVDQTGGDFGVLPDIPIIGTGT
jgi:hypothetical protein